MTNIYGAEGILYRKDRLSMREMLDVVGVGSLPAWVLWISGVHFLVGLALWLSWRSGGTMEPVVWFIQGPSAVFMFGSAIVETILAFRVWRSFSPKQALWIAWACLTFAGVCRAAGMFVAHVLTPQRGLIVIPGLAGNTRFHEWGLLFSGPYATLLMLVAFGIAVFTYWRLGARARFRVIDFVVVSVAGVYVGREMYELLVLYPGSLRDWTSYWRWAMDPILLLTLIGALTLIRATRMQSGGLVGMTWAMYAVGVFFTFMGNACIWMVNYGHLAWDQASAVLWFVWLPISTAFAIAPAFQSEAISRIKRGWRP